MRFEFYVLNSDFNSRKVKMFNIFDNCHVQAECERETRKYLRSSKKYTSQNYTTHETYTGWKAFCEEIRKIIMWQEWGRCEYEIAVSDPFENDSDKWDCYMQAQPNIEIICREILYQYKKQKKEGTGE